MYICKTVVPYHFAIGYRRDDGSALVRKLSVYMQCRQPASGLIKNINTNDWKRGAALLV